MAAVLIEPVITSDGLILPPEGYFEKVQALCRANDVLILADEVSTGMGRTGEWYACSHYGLVPDVVYLAKSLTSGYAPLSAVLTTEEIYQTIHSKGRYFLHGSTFSGHPVACVAAEKVLHILSKEKLVARAGPLGQFLASEFQRELGNLAHIGSINGKGLLFEIELVGDKKKRLRRPNPSKRGWRFIWSFCDAGNMCAFWVGRCVSRLP